MGNALHLENVTMQFGGVVSVNNLTLDVPEHKIIALIGPNGAGKTTAFNCITGVYKPTNGLIEFMGKPMVRNMSDTLNNNPVISNTFICNIP